MANVAAISITYNDTICHMQALCVCQYGHSRSVALVRRLHHRGINAVAAGVGTAGPLFLKAMCDEATHIFLMEPHFVLHIPKEFRHKVVVMDVGPDIWSNPYNQELLQKVDDLYTAWEKSHG